MRTRPAFFGCPVLHRPPVHLTEPVHIESDHHEEQPSDLDPEEDLYVLSDDASWLVSMQPPQERRRDRRREPPPRRFVPVEPPQHAQIRDEELAGSDRRGRGRVGETRLNGADSSLVAPAKENGI